MSIMLADPNHFLNLADGFVMLTFNSKSTRL
jgi:hypothetical protein